MPKTKIQNQMEGLINHNYNWQIIRDKYTLDQLNQMSYWLSIEKEKDKDLNEDEIIDDVNPSQLNKCQKFTFNLIDKFNNEKKQMLMILLGTAGTGKSFTVSAISKLKVGQIKRACPTAKAAFIIKGI